MGGFGICSHARMSPVQNVLKRSSFMTEDLVESLRGGASENIDETIHQLGVQFGPDFLNAIEQVRSLLWRFEVLVCI